MMRLPEFTFPPVVARVGGKLPQWVPSLALVTTLNFALGRVLDREVLAPLMGRRFVIEVSDVGMRLRFTYRKNGFAPCFEAGAPDLILSAHARDYIALLMREEDPDTLFFNRRLRMQGDTDLGLLVKNTLDGVDFPWLDFLHLIPSRWLQVLPSGATRST